ncbi:MAG: hypothetical protein ACRCST_07485 [Turicibacter sp.]
MINKLTYKIQEILSKNNYTEVVIKQKLNGESVTINDAAITFRYTPESDKGCLSFGKSSGENVCQISDEKIKEVIVSSDAITIETDERTYHCYQNVGQLF